MCIKLSIRCNATLVLLLLISLKVSSQRLIAHYPMNNNAKDLSPFHNDGYINGGVTTIPDRFDNPCSALLFDGYSGYIQVPSSASLESPKKQLSMTVWYKITNANSENNWLTVLCKGGGTTEESYNPQYRFQIFQSTNPQLTKCSPYFEKGFSTVSMTTAFTICDNGFENHLFRTDEWHFYALTYDGNDVKVYMDGDLVFLESYNQFFEKNNDPLFIGKDIPGTTEFFNGALDELKIFDYTLSPSAILNMFNEKGTYSTAEDFEMDFPQHIYLETNKDDCFALANFSKPRIKTNCGNVTVNQIEGLSSGASFPVGRNRIVFEAKSTSGYTQNATFYVTVADKTPPKITLQSDTIILINKGSGGINVDFNESKVSDNCFVKELVLIEGKQTGSYFPVGKTRIKYVATDVSGNKASASFIIEIREKKEAPVIITHDTTVIVNKPPITKPDTIVVLNEPPIIDTVKDTPIFIQETDSSLITETKYTDTLSTNYKPNNIVFLIDASSSMGKENKMDHLKYAITKLVKILRTIDYLTIITYADSIKLSMSRRQIIDKDSIISIINNIKTIGGTEGAKALEYSYSELKKNYLYDGNNEIYLASDMEFDVEKKQEKLIKTTANDDIKPINLNIMAFIASNRPVDALKNLSDMGKGVYLPITSEDAADFLINQIKIKSIK